MPFVTLQVPLCVSGERSWWQEWVLALTLCSTREAPRSTSGRCPGREARWGATVASPPGTLPKKLPGSLNWIFLVSPELCLSHLFSSCLLKPSLCSGSAPRSLCLNAILLLFCSLLPHLVVMWFLSHLFVFLSLRGGFVPLSGYTE